MRQLMIQAPRGHAEAVLSAARDLGGANLACWRAGDADDLVMVHVSNGQVEPLLGRLEGMPDLRITLAPRGVIVLRPPASETPDQVTDVEARSPIEIFLGGLQSVGSWTGFLSYALAAGVVVWIGLFTNTGYLLVAAMLIAPFAGPAMNAALATARGDSRLLGQSLARYAGGLGTAVAVSWLLSMVLAQQIATTSMISNSQVSTVAVLLPLVAGAAGALNLAQSERNSLVSGAAVGMLVAASLAPPAGLIGMSAAIGRWDLAGSGAFLLALQLAGINLAGAAVFRLYGVSPDGPRFARGRGWIFPASLAASALIGLLLLGWQFAENPNLRRSSLAQRATAEVEQAVSSSDLAGLVEANVRFTRSQVSGQDTLLAVVYVQRQQAGRSPESIRSALTAAIRDRLERAGLGVTPLVDVHVLDPPGGPGG